MDYDSKVVISVIESLQPRSPTPPHYVAAVMRARTFDGNVVALGLTSAGIESLRRVLKED